MTITITIMIITIIKAVMKKTGHMLNNIVTNNARKRT